MIWELFEDFSFNGMYAVRPLGDFDLNSPRLFHFAQKADAEKFKELAEKAHVAKPESEIGVMGGFCGFDVLNSGARIEPPSIVGEKRKTEIDIIPSPDSVDSDLLG